MVDWEFISRIEVVIGETAWLLAFLCSRDQIGSFISSLFLSVIKVDNQSPHITQDPFRHAVNLIRLFHHFQQSSYPRFPLFQHLPLFFPSIDIA